MLILSRKLGESIVIDGHIRVQVMRVEGDVVKLGDFVRAKIIKAENGKIGLSLKQMEPAQ